LDRKILKAVFEESAAIMNTYLFRTEGSRGSIKTERRLSRAKRKRGGAWAQAILFALAAGPAALAQTTNTPSVNSPDTAGSTNVTKLAPTTVVGRLDEAREQIVPSLGATSYSINREVIETLPQGQNTPFNQVLLRAPGMAQDSLGQLHLRGEHANLQYRINDVLLPEGITGFGQELDTRFVDEVHVVTGSLPAQYGFRTAGIIDIHTKNGAFEPGGEAGVYGGSYDTVKPSFEYGGSHSNLNYYFSGSYDHNGFGIEAPTPAWRPIHDDTDQYKGFAYLSYILDDTSRITVMGSGSYATFELPNTPGLPAGNLPSTDTPTAVPWSSQMGISNFNSLNLDERQNEGNYYGVVAYQKSVGDLNLQVAGFGRSSSVHFKPDPTGDLFFDGVASDIDRILYSGGGQADASYALTDQHTLRGGLMILDESATTHSKTTVFPVDSDGNPTGPAFPVKDNTTLSALNAGAYIQDEWKVLPKVTLNFGGRFDIIDSFVHENQFSGRFNAIYEPTKMTTLHAGYARYFTPPPLETVNPASVQKFNGTSNGSEVQQADPPHSERANYFDAGFVQKIPVVPGLQFGVDGYYKRARNQLDDGFFGSSLIPSSFNYDKGDVHGVEFTTSYNHNGASIFANVAYSHAQGKQITSSQFLFGQDDLNYIRNHWIFLDHDQEITGSFGAAYTFERDWGTTRVYVDALYGSGLRSDAAHATVTVPNGDTVASYYSVNMGIEETFKIRGKRRIKARFDVVNITDNTYELRDGSGIGVNAAQFGMRLGFFGGVSVLF
jgi:outer membrane receptor protein involved in Fe transport